MPDEVGPTEDIELKANAAYSATTIEGSPNSQEASNQCDNDYELI